MHKRIQRIQFGRDLRRRLGSGERLGIGVVLGDVALDRGLQGEHRAEDAPFEPAAGRGEEEGLDRVQPRTRGRGEVKATISPAF
jgi:hypothetical protein